MRDKLRKKITSAFEVARQEGQLGRELDVTADVDDVMAWIEEEGYTRQPEPPEDMARKKADEIVRNMAGRRPDFPDGKEFVDQIRHDEPSADRVEAVARKIYEGQMKLAQRMGARYIPSWEEYNSKEWFLKLAREISKLYRVKEE